MLIVGAGPVGLTLAIDLAWRGIDVTVAETRARAAPPEPKCNHVAARTMEIFRRLGVADKVRDAGLPADYPHDISYRTSFTGQELTRIPIPCRRDRFTMTDGPDCNWPTPEPPHRINQIFLEPILFEHAAASRASASSTASRSRTSWWRILPRASACAISTATRVRRLSCRYPDRLRRRALGGPQGDRRRALRRRRHPARAVDLYPRARPDRSPAARARLGHRRRSIRAAPAWCMRSMAASDGWCTITCSRTRRTSKRSIAMPASAPFSASDADFEYDMISKEDWFGRRLIANKFRDRCAFIAGDAAHIWVPYAGYGMNAGIADAMNLSWLLAAHLNGWAPASILDAYEAERWPITSQVSRFAMSHAEAEIRRRGAVPDEHRGCRAPRANRRAQEVGRLAYEINVQQYACAGLNFGTYYDRSPIIAYDGAEHPAYTMDSYTPSTVPGCRTPHLWRDGRPLALRRDGAGVHAAAVRSGGRCHAARSRGAQPGCAAQGARRRASGGRADFYGSGLVLSRPDQHVAWRGNSATGRSAGADRSASAAPRIRFARRAISEMPNVAFERREYRFA